MAQQQHSSEIVVSIDDTQVARAVQGLTEQFKGLQQSAQQAVQQAGQAATQAGQRVAQAAHTATGGLSTEAAAAGVYAGRGAMAVGGAVGRGAMAVGSPLARMAGAALPIVGGIARSLISTRMARTGDAQSLEIPQTELRFGGGYELGQIGSARRVGAGFGMTPQETVQMLQGFSAQVGERFQLQGETLRNVMEAQRFGVSSRAFAGFGAGGALGGGAMSGNVATETELALRVAQVGRTMGLSGGGVERLLASISQATQSMASQGLSLDTESMASFMNSISTAAESAGDRRTMGEGAMRAISRVQGMTGGALQSFRGQFGQIGQGALQAAAARNARSPLEMIQNLEAMMSDPRRALEAMQGMGLSSDVMQLALTGAGASTTEAQRLMEGLSISSDMSLVAPRMGRGGESVTGGLALSRASAMRANELTSMIESNKAASVAMINLSAKMEKLALSMTTNDALLTKTLVGLDATITSLVEKGGRLAQVGDDLRALKDKFMELIP
jgi:hypothetical protein